MNVDEEISVQEKKIIAYTEPNAILDNLIQTFYFISSIMFGLMFVLVSGELLSNSVSSTLDINEAKEISFVIYLILALALYILWTVFICKKYDEVGFSSYSVSLLSGPAAIPCVWLLTGIFSVIITILAFVIGIAIIGGILYCILSS